MPSTVRLMAHFRQPYRPKKRLKMGEHGQHPFKVVCNLLKTNHLKTFDNHAHRPMFRAIIWMAVDAAHWFRGIG
jgi:hypothetical protein